MTADISKQERLQADARMETREANRKLEHVTQEMAQVRTQYGELLDRISQSQKLHSDLLIDMAQATSHHDDVKRRTSTPIARKPRLVIDTPEVATDDAVTPLAKYLHRSLED
jgi:hypothetical protein